MTTTLLEKTAEQIAGNTHKVADFVKEGFGTAKQFVKESEELADELYDTTTRQIQRHPAESVTMTFLAGFGVGMLTFWLLRRK